MDSGKKIGEEKALASKESHDLMGESGRLPQKSNYHNDYSPRYQKPYNIYDKAREHMKKVKKTQSDVKVTKA